MKFLGINIRLHWSLWITVSFLLMPAFLSSDGGVRVLKESFFVLSLFGSVLFHEYAHALTARYFGCSTKEIVLNGLGGIAYIDNITELSPKQDVTVSLAGPMSNFLLAVVSFALASLVMFIKFQMDWATEELTLTTGSIVEYSLLLLGVINIFIGMFNLIPAYPMDGGRILRAVGFMYLPRQKAIDYSAITAFIIGICFLITGISYGGIMIIVLSAMIFLVNLADIIAVYHRIMLVRSKRK